MQNKEVYVKPENKCENQTTEKWNKVHEKSVNRLNFH